MEKERSEKFQALSFLVLLLIFIFLEQKDLIEPKQYHVVDQSYPPINFSISTTISGTVASGVSVYPGPIFFTPIDEMS